VVVAQAAPAALPEPAPQPEPRPVVQPKPKPKPEPEAQERIPRVDELPESVRRTLPQVVIGGYIYSQNPADRLLLVDKVLRREGDQVAPGLTLEKLLPKAVVLNYNGVRYRQAY
jgi:general secretion pathway protein B